MIEVNDSTHNQVNRIDRDLKVQKICNEANIPLIKFYTVYPNDKEYVVSRVRNEIKRMYNN